MNAQKVIQQLKQKYPGRNIIENKDSDGETFEIVCELGMHESGKYTEAIMVADRFRPHYHKKTLETFVITSGKLEITIDGEPVTLAEGEEIIVKPGQVHSGIGNETWALVTSSPRYLENDTYSE